MSDSTPPTEEELANLVRDLAEMKAGQAGWGASASRALKLLPRLARAYGALLADIRDAAGELLVDMPEPGTVVSKLLLANVLMRRERERFRDERDTALAEVPARLKADREAAALYGALDTASKDAVKAVEEAAQASDAAYLRGLNEGIAKGRRDAIEAAAAHLVGEEQSRAAAMILAVEDALRTKRGPS